MEPLPAPETYNEGLAFWPYKSSLELVLDHLTKNAKRSDILIDVMCGPGWLIEKIHERRPDLSLNGLDMDARYVEYARRNCPFATIEHGDIRKPTSSAFDVVVCTGSLHHLPYEQQELGITNIASLLVAGGFAVISDCYIDDYSTETERQKAAAVLGAEYLYETIRNRAPANVLGWTADILKNDVLMDEFKTSIAKRLPLLKRHFTEVSTIKTWPADKSDGYGDYVHICTL